MNNEQQEELERLEHVLAVAKRNGNELFIQNIEREITAVQRGECSPLIDEYLTEEERASRGFENRPRSNEIFPPDPHEIKTRLQATNRHTIPKIDLSDPQGNAS